MDGPQEVRSRGVLRAERAVRLLRWGVVTTFAGAAAALFASETLRATLVHGTRLLVAGDVDGLRRWGESLGPWGPLCTSALMIVQALAAPIPAVFVTWANSLLYGPFLGGVLSIVSATVAAGLCFALARAFGEPLVRRFLSDRARERAESFVDRHGALAILIARLVPVVPFDPISFVAGLSGMRVWSFTWATLVGQIPAGMTYSYLGQEIGDPARFALLGVCAVLALLLFGWAVRRALLGNRGPDGGSDPEPR